MTGGTPEDFVEAHQAESFRCMDCIGADYPVAEDLVQDTLSESLQGSGGAAALQANTQTAAAGDDRCQLRSPTRFVRTFGGSDRVAKHREFGGSPDWDERRLLRWLGAQPYVQDERGRSRLEPNHPAASEKGKIPFDLESQIWKN